jgi:putative ABC transport system ATP-binding protein
MESDKPFIHLDQVKKEYRPGKILVPALRGISLSLERGRFAALMGPSGSGKTTLLNLMGLLDEPDTGEVILDGQTMIGKKDRELSRIRRKQIGFIFQMFNLIPICTVFENIEYPLLNSEVPVKYRKKAVIKRIEEVELSGLENRFPSELSGGQQQRVAIARALVHSPSLIIADEPTANLDSKTGAVIIDLLHRLSRDYNTTVVLATHDPEILKRTERVIQIHDGLLTGGMEAGV